MTSVGAVRRTLAAVAAAALGATLLTGCSEAVVEAIIEELAGGSTSGEPTGGDSGDASTGTGDAGAGFPIPDDAFAMRVVEVVDGDTARLQVVTPNDVVDATWPISVRLIGIDTPEVYPQYECFGDEAEAELLRLAPLGSTVYAAPDVDSWDDYDRRLFYLWTPDGVFINLALVEGGFAEAIRVMPNDFYFDELLAAEIEADAAHRGMWAAC